MGTRQWAILALAALLALPTPAKGAGLTGSAPGEHERKMGLWAVDVATGEQRQLRYWKGASIGASRDLRRIAVVGRPVGEGIPARPGAMRADPLRGAIRVGAPGADLRVLWKPPQDVIDMPADHVTEVRWAPDGQRLFIGRTEYLVAANLAGKARLFGTAARPVGGGGRRFGKNAAPPPAPDPHAHLSFKCARWAGRNSRQLVVGSPRRNALYLLDIASGRSKPLCPCPPGFMFAHGPFEVSSDLRTVAFFNRMSNGVWVWRKGRGAPVQLCRGSASAGALSPNGKYVVAAVTDGSPARASTTRLWKTTDGSEAWRTDPKTYRFGAASAAFSPDSRQVCLSLSRRLAVTSIDAFAPRWLFDRAKYVGGAGALMWSADGKTVVLRTGLPNPNVIIRPQ